MKHFPLSFFAPLVLAFGGDTQPALSPLYQQEIVISETSSTLLQQSAEVFAARLKEITGKEFKVSRRTPGEREDSIQLWIETDAINSAVFKPETLRKLDPNNREAFVIEGGDHPGLRIVGKDEQAIKHGVYRYLNELGFRSFLPGPNWQILPRREDIRLPMTIADAPAFRQRQFFGTGGFSADLPLDPNGEIKSMWDNWQAANLFGQSIDLGGHNGEGFIQRHKEALESNPDYRAMVDGERVPMSDQFQLNYGNKELRELYIEDRLAEAREASKKAGAPVTGIALSVEPADSSGHCTSPEALALGSLSDRVFGLANEVAKKVSAEFPGNYVNLFAYNEHADPPSFPLESNVIVSIIPYGFSRARKITGDDLLMAWKEKGAILGLYDYWALPDWSRDRPQLDFLHAIPKKLRFWYQNNVRFFNAETTTSGGAAGIALYQASKILWNPEVDDRKSLAEFYDLAFGIARPPMQKMLERWAADFQLNSNELGLSFRDLEAAWKLAENQPEILARIGDFVTFVQYLHLLNRFESAAEESPERSDNANTLIRYVWQIRANAMVQTFRITQLAINIWMREDQDLKQTWNFTDPSAPGWASVPSFPTREEILATLRAGVANYPVLFEPTRYSSDLVPLFSNSRGTKEMLETPLTTVGYTCIFSAADKILNMEVFFGESTKFEGIVKVTDPEQDDQVVYYKNLPLDGKWQSVAIPVQKGKTYKLTVDSRGLTTQLRFPSNWPLVVPSSFSPATWVTTKAWFFVPRGTTRFGLSIPENPIPQNLIVTAEDGSVVDPVVSEGGLTVYDVHPQDQGKVWSVEKFVSSVPVRLFNVPDNLSFSPETIMVPRELKGKTSK